MVTPFHVGTVSTVWLDGVAQADGCIAMVDDGVEHSVELNHPRAR
jgi:cyclic beta-1,2-glucan synthetase